MLRLLGVWLVLLMTTLGQAALAAGPPFPDREVGSGAHVVDEAEVLPRAARSALDEGLRALLEKSGVDLVVFLQVKPSAKGIEDATEDARALLDQWGVGGEDGNGAVLLLDFDKRKQAAWSGIAGGTALVDRVGQQSLETTVADTVDPSLAVGAWQTAVTQGVVALTALATGGPIVGPEEPGATPAPGATARPRTTPVPGTTPLPLGPSDKDPVPPPGPPFPDPVPGVTVHDYAHVLDKETETFLAEIAWGIEERTGAEVAIVTQLKPSADTPAEAEADAIALMDQWGVGRAGFDDGLVILLDLDESRCHGQVQLYAGPGFRETFLTNEDRDALYREVMFPSLAACDLRTALIDAMTRIDLAATPERARTLQVTRQVDAVTGLVLTPLLVLGLIGWAAWSWLRYGRDPEVADDPSVLMAAPPPGLSPAAATVIAAGRAVPAGMTSAIVDLAARGELRIDVPEGSTEAALELLAPDGRDPRVVRSRRIPLGPAESWLLERIREIAGPGGRLEGSGLKRLGAEREGFDDRLEHHVASEGWFAEPPELAVERWQRRGGAVVLLGVAAIILADHLPSTGVLMAGWGGIVSGIALIAIGRAMPQRTLQGARTNAWLAAYRRTLRLTMEQSRTMDQVIASHAVPWLETPDQAAVWAHALGLQDELDAILERSVALARDQRSGTGIWFPDWYGAAGAAAGITGSGTGSSPTIGSFPSFAAMGAVLATVGSAVGGSGGGASGGFSGGSSGGGGGGAGGGF